jgi:Amt family ammonium transporter
MNRTTKAWLIPLTLLLLTGAAGLALSQTNPSAVGGAVVGADVAWMLTATALVLLMTPGLSFFYGGMVQRKNLVSTMLQSFIAMGVVSVVWVVAGFSLSFGESIGGVVGNPLSYFMFDGVGASTHPDLSPTIPLALFAMFQLKFAIITPALITGGFAERVRFSAYVLFLVLFSVFIYAPLAHATWHPDGLLRQWGVLDFAGGTVVHMSAGFAALAGAIVLGRRRIHRESRTHTPTNIPYVLLGAGMLWFGWFGFNCGSALSASPTAVLAFVNTNTASAAAMLAWVFFDSINGRKISALGACCGTVVGLVAITPAAGYVTVGQSIVIGIAAGLICNIATRWRMKTKLDDTLDVFACHGVGGVVGMVATGLFADKVGLIYGDPTVFLHHLVAIVVVGVFAFGGSMLLYKVTDKLIPLRVKESDEDLGLDLTQHKERADDSGGLRQAA